MAMDIFQVRPDGRPDVHLQLICGKLNDDIVAGTGYTTIRWPERGRSSFYLLVWAELTRKKKIPGIFKM